MRVKLNKHGNSLGFVVPASVVREGGLEAGQEYELEVTEGGALHLMPTHRPVWRPDLSIDDLLAGLPEEPLKYEDVPEYVPVGRELDW
ncbi:AbrB/MazE/SpoVT family DNA-binding domain-containing protein [Deinococcus sp. YIM 134068]|uniref:AbrB/MazE/SpoVT family DNA-binding domain-containing protein n=1 Tax=Deinococcus lichenicola TaxID=3118910 RepID=UPI002F92081C